MEDALRRVLDELSSGDVARTPLFQLALLHEDMHGEALVMTRKTLGLPVPSIPFLRMNPGNRQTRATEVLGWQIPAWCANAGYQFDNEFTTARSEIAPFEMDGQPVSSADFAAWKGQPLAGAEWGNGAACHVNYVDAAAYARDLGRRLPTEAEWEFACMRSSDFQASTGQVWEWTSSRFEPRPALSRAHILTIREPHSRIWPATVRSFGC